MGVPEVIESAVALATGGLAYVTWKMATATQRMAEASQAELAFLGRQTEAAELGIAQGEAQLAQTGTPRFSIVRADGDRIDGGQTDDGRWTVMVENTGPVPAEIESAALSMPRAGLALTPSPTGAIPRAGTCELAADMGGLRSRLQSGEEFNFRVVYPDGAARKGRARRASSDDAAGRARRRLLR